VDILKKEEENIELLETTEISIEEIKKSQNKKRRLYFDRK